MENGAVLNVLGAIKIGETGESWLTLHGDGDSFLEEAQVYADEIKVGTQNNDAGGEVLVEGGTWIVTNSYEQYSTQPRSLTKVTGENSLITAGSVTLAGGDFIIEEGASVFTATTGTVSGVDSPKVTVDGAGSDWKLDGNFTFGAAGGNIGEVVVSDGGIIESTTGIVQHNPNGHLLGNSTIKAKTIVSEDNAAWILPGINPGDMHVLTLDGDWDASGGVTYFVDAHENGGTSDQIYVTGTATLGGILNVSLHYGTPSGGEEYIIVLAEEGLSGTFNLAGSDLPSLPPGLHWGADYGQMPSGDWYAKLVIFQPVLELLGITYDDGNQVGEGAGTAIFTVGLNLETISYLTENVLVDYQTLNDTATAGQDYVATSGTLVFSPQQHFQTFEVTILDDLDIESIEKFLVSIFDGRTASGKLVTINLSQDFALIVDNDQGAG